MIRKLGMLAAIGVALWRASGKERPLVALHRIFLDPSRYDGRSIRVRIFNGPPRMFWFREPELRTSYEWNPTRYMVEARMTYGLPEPWTVSVV